MHFRRFTASIGMGTPVGSSDFEGGRGTQSNVLRPIATPTTAQPPMSSSGRAEPRTGLRGLRRGYSPNLGHARVDKNVADLVADAVKVFEMLGALVEEVRPPWGLPDLHLSDCYGKHPSSATNQPTREARPQWILASSRAFAMVKISGSRISTPRRRGVCPAPLRLGTGSRRDGTSSSRRRLQCRRSRWGASGQRIGRSMRGIGLHGPSSRIRSILVMARRYLSPVALPRGLASWSSDSGRAQW